MIPESRLDQIVARSRQLEKSLTETTDPSEIARLAQAHAEIQDAVQHINRYRAVTAELSGLRELAADPEFEAEANREIPKLEEQLAAAEAQLREALVPPDALDSRTAIVEIRAGTGGQEASLFARDLGEMYSRYAEGHRWSVEEMERSTTDVGGLRSGMFRVSGKGVFARLKFEAGVHRVQRVPDTEASGRIHTSTASVAVLPEPEPVEIDIPEKDIRIDTFRASGAGGQHVNKTDSAVRITHLPTNIVVVSSEKSQHRNRDIAMRVLRARLFEAQQAEQMADRAEGRRSQIRGSRRADKIRTYNFPQDRITDHRINQSWHNLPKIMEGELDDIIDALAQAERAELLAMEIGDD